MIKINVILNNISWLKHTKNPKNYIDKKSFKINKKNNLYKKKILIFSLLLSNSTEIKKLNKKFRNKNKSTDVLSFPFYSKSNLKKTFLKDKEIYLGDIIVNLNQIKNKNDKKKFRHQLNKLWIHGFFHLLGYDHKTEKNFNEMRNLENKFLNLI